MLSHGFLYGDSAAVLDAAGRIEQIGIKKRPSNKILLGLVNLGFLA